MLQVAAADERQQQHASVATPAACETADMAASTAAAAPWSACHLWDPNPFFASGPPQAQQQPTRDCQQQQAQGQASRFKEGQQQTGSDATAGRKQSQVMGTNDGEEAEDTEMSEAGDAEDGEHGQAGSTSGCLGLSCGE